MILSNSSTTAPYLSGCFKTKLHSIHNAGVPGSSPGIATTFPKVIQSLINSIKLVCFAFRQLILAVSTTFLLLFTHESFGEVLIKMESNDLVYSDCDLVWTAQQGRNHPQTFIDLACTGAPIGGASTYVGGNTTIYVNAKSYTCPVDLFVFTSVPNNQVVIYMDCRSDDSVFQSGFGNG